MDAKNPNRSAAGAPESSRRSAVSAAAPAIAAAAPVALVNATAFIGQFAWVQDHVPWVLPEQVMFAVTVESVAVYLAWAAHRTLLANDSAGRLKLGAYSFALIIGAMNYSHYAHNWRPNALAVALGLMSALSPWLWGVHSKRVSRDKLKALSLIEEHGVRLGANRWLWHPVRSTVVTSRSAWSGENNPRRAIAEYEAARPNRAFRRAVAQGGLVAALPRQEIEQILGAPEAEHPAAPAIEAPAAPVEHPVPGWIATEQAARQAGAVEQPAPAAPPAAPAAKTVPAIAALTASPRLEGLHEIDPERLAATVAHLNSLVASELPSDRAVGKLLCPEPGHNHRRPAKGLIDARRLLGHAPVAPRRTLRTVPENIIASPAANLPGGATANG